MQRKSQLNHVYSKQSWAAICLLAAFLFTAPFAAAASGESENGIFSLIFVNDIFANSDRYYTDGLRLSWLTAPDKTPGWALRTALWFPWLSKGDGVRASYSVGQDIYTPRDTCSPNPPLDDRPYAGWLYGAIGLVSATGGRLDRLELTVGVVGPASQGEEMQNLAHDLLDTNETNGWKTQLKNEPGIILAYQRSWRNPVAASMFGLPFDLTPYAGAALGNVFTHANVGLLLRYGNNLSHDFGLAGFQPVLAGSGLFIPQEGVGWYLFAAIDGRAVARNIFLDGNTFRDSRSVEKKPLVGGLQFGLAVIYGRVRFGYTHVLQTHEFESQKDGIAGFVALSLSVLN